MPYSLHSETGHGGEAKVAIFNKDKDKVVAHTTAPTRAEAIKKAKRVEQLHEMFKHMRAHGMRSEELETVEVRSQAEAVEERILHGTVEVRVKDGKEKIVGHFPYNNISNPLGGGEFREVFKPGVFAKHLKSKPDVIAKWNHGRQGMGLPLGRTSSGTLKVEEREDGLHYELDPADTQEGRDVLTSIKRGDVPGTSIGFVAKRDKYSRDGGGYLREVHEAELTDVSPTANPAYPNTNLRVALRSLESVDGEEYRRLMEYQEERSIKPGDFVKGFLPHGEASARSFLGKVVESRGEGKLTLPGTELYVEGHRSNPAHMVAEYRDDDMDGAHEPSGHMHLVRERSLDKLDGKDVPSDEEMIALFDLAKKHEEQEIQEKSDRLRLLEHSGPMVGVGANLDGEPSYE